MENFIYNYFIRPILDHSGYNIVNTLVYAAIAIMAIYAIYRMIKGRIAIDSRFITSVLCFVLLGSTMRVVTDSIDTGVFKPVTIVHEWMLDSHMYDYPSGVNNSILNYLMVSPGVYLLVSFVLFASIIVLHRIKRMHLLGYIGLALWLPHLLLLLPFMGYAIYAIPVILLAAVPTYLAFRFLKDRIATGVVAGHALDGAATFFVIDIFSKISGIQYGEQHVFSAGIGEITGTFFSFYLVKIAISLIAANFLIKEKMEIDERNYIALVLMIIGFAPGIRDMLRMMIGA